MLWQPHKVLVTISLLVMQRINIMKPSVVVQEPGPGFHGASAVHTHMTNTQLTDPEILEWHFPVLLEQFSIRPNSGGEGAYKGGDGVIRRLRFLEAMTVNIISSHRRIPPYGLQGGSPGRVGHNGVLEELGGCARVEMQIDDVLSIETPGGGGFGKS